MGSGISTEDAKSMNDRQRYQYIYEHIDMPMLQAYITADAKHSSLAADTSDTLPSHVLEKGRAVLLKLKVLLLSSFSETGVTGGGRLSELPQIAEILEVIGISSLLPSLLPYLDEYNLEKYIEKCIEGIEKNPIFMFVAAELSDISDLEQRLCFFSDEDISDDDRASTLGHLRKAIIYSSVLHAISMAFIFESVSENNFCSDLFKLIGEKMDTSPWKQYGNLFEAMKVATVKIPVKYYVERKNGQADEIDDKATPIKSSILLQANILEAMYQDVISGNTENANVGFEVMAVDMDSHLPTLEQVVDEPFVHDGNNMGVTLSCLPYHRAWCNLYNAWNTAFVLQYAENPYFLAKLLCPAVSTMYHEREKRLYMPARVVALYVHIGFVMMSRVQTEDRTFATLPGWMADPFRAMLTKVNKTAAEEYQRRVEDALEQDEGVYKNAMYDTGRAVKMALWTTVKEVTELRVAMSEAGEDITDGFQKAVSVFGMDDVYRDKDYKN